MEKSPQRDGKPEPVITEEAGGTIKWYRSREGDDDIETAVWVGMQDRDDGTVHYLMTKGSKEGPSETEDRLRFDEGEWRAALREFQSTDPGARWRFEDTQQA